MLFYRFSNGFMRRQKSNIEPEYYLNKAQSELNSTTLRNELMQSRKQRLNQNDKVLYTTNRIEKWIQYYNK